MALVYFDAMGEAGASREPPRCTTRCTGLACCEPMRPPLSDHVTPRLRMTSVAASLKAGGSEGGPAETCAGKRPRRAGGSGGLPEPSRAAVRCWWRVGAVVCGLWPSLGPSVYGDLSHPSSHQQLVVVHLHLVELLLRGLHQLRAARRVWAVAHGRLRRLGTCGHDVVSSTSKY